jgi:hypothetical protein
MRGDFLWMVFLAGEQVEEGIGSNAEPERNALFRFSGPMDRFRTKLSK